MRELRGRLALVTGASSGLGPFIARRLHLEGIRLVLSARRRPELERLARELVGSRVVTADLSMPEEVERLAAEAGPVDLLVANAGVPASGPLLDFTVEQLDRALDVNLRAPLVLARLLLPGMVARGRGHLVLIASMAGQVAAARLSVYAATKFGLRGLGHGLRAELRGTGVGVSIVSPFYVGQAGLWAETGVRSSLGEVSPARVAEAVVDAVRRDRAEVTVAPAPVRLLHRLPMAVPELVHTPLGRWGAHPGRAVEAQRAKR
ncbi:MAG TPA: SDR family NAD(P)-dependent oxidoreductase [Candidatus Dormibacteraeota bacterium]|nr:SDR family NAD(P)-dependent oxidoreductase [Candidatus Dormibacteraeota bacterium]